MTLFYIKIIFILYKLHNRIKVRFLLQILNNNVRKGILIKTFLIEQIDDFKRALKLHKLSKYIRNIIFENIDSNNCILKISVLFTLSAPSGAKKRRFAL